MARQRPALLPCVLSRKQATVKPRGGRVARFTTRLLNPDCRLLTLTGLGGSGKTRLAIEVATTVAAQFPHGTVFVALQPISRGDLLVSAIAQALGLTLYGEDESQEQLFAYLHDKTLLLILDNFEHLLDGAALVSTLLAAAPGVTLLVTSREALRLQEEWLYPLQGLATPLSVYATALEEYEAVQLFLSHAQRVQPAFDLASERESVIRICMMTAGLPLALELAASWLKGLHAAQIAQAVQPRCAVDNRTQCRGPPPQHAGGLRPILGITVGKRAPDLRQAVGVPWRLCERCSRAGGGGVACQPGGPG
jgi:predicted ATPase